MKRFEGFQRGVNLGGWLSQCVSYDKAHFDGFITEKDIKDIKSFGLDHVRVPVDYDVFMNESSDGDTVNEEGMAHIDDCIGWCRSNGLNMILDLHKANGYMFDTNEVADPDRFFTDKELQDDLGCYIPESGDLTHWAEQGVLLLNTLLTVRAHEAFSHKGKGWEEFTDAAIKAVAALDRPVVFILWGSAARAKKEFIKNPDHLVIESAHPSPLSAYRGFFGSRPFSKCNDFLVSKGIEPIDWQITD